jgi:hypothetical protein
MYLPIFAGTQAIEIWGTRSTDQGRYTPARRTIYHALFLGRFAVSMGPADRMDLKHADDTW